jgi:hypothetical protein
MSNNQKLYVSSYPEFTGSSGSSFYGYNKRTGFVSYDNSSGDYLYWTSEKEADAINWTFLNSSDMENWSFADTWLPINPDAVSGTGNARYMDMYATGENEYIMIMEYDHDEDGDLEMVLWDYSSKDSTNITLSGLTSDRITWSGSAGETVWCNATGDGNETLNVSISPSGTDILEVRVYLADMNDTSAWINASNVTLYASVDNATWREIGTFTDGGSNITMNDNIWTWADDPFPISSTDYIYCRFKLAIPSGQSADTYYSASSTDWNVYSLG